MQATNQPTGAHLWRRTLPAMAVAAALNSMAYAEQVQPAPSVLSEVKVVGQAASMDSALDVQQMADNIVSVVHADGIGQLPDANAAEALQRLPGVSVERDQGEGRYVRIRGLGPDLNAVTINGSLVPAPESGRRAVQMDVLPAGMIRSLEVTKTLTPSMDANSVGGTVDVKTLSAFDHQGLFYSLEGGLSHDTNTGKESPNFAGTVSNRFLDGTLGVSFGLSSSERKFGSDNVEAGAANWNANNQLKAMQRRDYTITRQRDGGMLNVEYKPTNEENYYLRTLYSRFSDDEVRQRNNITFSTNRSEGVLGNTTSQRELKARKESQDILSLTAGAERKLGEWDVAAAFGTTRSGEDTPQYINSARFNSGTTYQAGFIDTSRLILIGSSAINSATGYTLNRIQLAAQDTSDTENHLKLDLGRKLKLFGLDSELKFGAKASRRTKKNNQTAWSISGATFGSPALSGFVDNSVDYAYGDFSPGISVGAIKNLLGTVNVNNFIDNTNSTINDFTMHEDINAAYVQNTFNIGMTRILAGVRYESTNFRAKGTGLSGTNFVSNERDRRDNHVLPALHIRHDLDNDTSVRAAWTNSVVRPTFEQLAPGFNIVGTDATFGNPDLKPLKSANFDLGIERRLGYAGAASAYVFYKNIKDFTYNTNLAGTGNWVGYTTANTFANGDSASVSGLELAYAQSFSFLPAPWNGMLLSANATATHSSAEITGLGGGKRNIPLPSQSDLTYNIMLGYEKGPVSVRLAATYKSAYLLTIDPSGASGDAYVSPQMHYDFSSRYNISKSIQVVFEALNLSNEKYYVYAGNASRNSQYESYGRTYKLSAKIAAF